MVRTPNGPFQGIFSDCSAYVLYFVLVALWKSSYDEFEAVQTAHNVFKLV